MSLGELSLSTLRAAATIADLGSMKRAAAALHLTQPALSYQLRRLETAAGVQLFERKPRGMTPTTAGLRFLDTARTVLDEIDQLDNRLTRLADGVDGTLRIGSECATSYHWLGSLVQDFTRSHPSVEVSVGSEAYIRPIDAISQDRLEIALTTSPPQDNGLSVVPLFRDEIMAIVAPDHRLATRSVLSARDFADETVFVGRADNSDLLNQVLRPHGVRPRRVTEIPVTDGTIELVRAGLGVTAVAGWIVQPELEAGELVAIRITRPGLCRHWYAVTAALGTRPTYVDHFLEQLRDIDPERPRS